MQTKQYLGDGVYVDFNGHLIMLTAVDLQGKTNTIYLEPHVYEALTDYVKRIKESQQKKTEEEET